MRIQIFTSLLFCLMLFSCDKTKIAETGEVLIYESDTVFANRIDTVTVASGFNIPWGIEILPNGDLLIGDKEGKLFRSTNGELTEITGLPEVWVHGQGGLLDLKLHPDYENNGWLYMSHSYQEGSTETGNTAISRAKIQGNELVELEEIFRGTPLSDKPYHFGSRIIFDNAGQLYFSIGDRGDWDNAQKLDNHAGKIHRINDDGSIPVDNPFVNEEGAMKSIFTYGNRNPQGLAYNPTTNTIWENEHGPMGGDEVNNIRAGLNFGWPAITYGINYNGDTISPDTKKEGMEQPEVFWRPSIAPSGLAVINTNKYGEDLKGDLLTGSLKFNYLHYCTVENGKIVNETKVLDGIGRMRTIKEAPDGTIYLGLENPGRVVKLEVKQ